MLSHIIESFQASAARSARGAALAFGALFAIYVGVAFLTLATWLFLVSVTTPGVASLILGLIFIGAGLILWAVIAKRARDRKRAAAIAAAAAAAPIATGASGLTGLVLAFISGMTAGQKARF